LTDSLIAYHNDPDLRVRIIAELEAHRAADRLVKGQYWEGGKGCAVGARLLAELRAGTDFRRQLRLRLGGYVKGAIADD
jgi:hypothetical protein